MPYPHTPGSKGEADTGKKAAEQMKDKAGTLRRMALDCLSMNLFRADLDGRSSGMTADEVATKCRCDILAMRPRLSELKRRGIIEDSGQRRSNKSGKLAVVWQLALNPQPRNGVDDVKEPTGEGSVSLTSQQSDLFRGDDPGRVHQDAGSHRANSRTAFGV